MGAVVTDFWPLRDPTRWVDDVKKAISPDIPFIQVNCRSFHFSNSFKLVKHFFFT